MKNNLPNARPSATAKALFCVIVCASALSLSACGKKAAEPTSAERLKKIAQNQENASKAEANANAPKTAESEPAGTTPVTK
jgi:hypothetical protein